MPRATNKSELLKQANMQFDKLQMLIESMSKQQQEAVFCFEITEKDKEAHWARDKNLRDVLIHLYEWHQLLQVWVKSNQNTSIPVSFLPAPYTWKNYAGMNQDFFEKHQQTSLDEAKKLILQSHKDVIALIEGFSCEELFTKAYFQWSGTTSVGAYCISATSSHYDWAMKKIKRQIKALG